MIIKKDWVTLIEIKGENNYEYLQKTTSNDLTSIDTEFVKTAILNNLGKVLCVFLVFRINKRIFVEIEKINKRKLFAELDKSIKLMKCSYEENNDFIQYLITEDERDLLKKSQKEKILKYKLNKLSLQNIILDKDSKFISTTLGFKDFNKLRVIDGLAMCGIDYDQSYIISETGVDAVSYTKGCFPGQEIVQKIKTYAGKVAKKIVRVNVGADVKDVEKIFSDKEEVGRVTSVVSESGKYFGIATLKRGYYDGDKELVTETGKRVEIVRERH